MGRKKEKNSKSPKMTPRTPRFQHALKGTIIENFELTPQNAHWLSLLELCILSMKLDSAEER